MSGAPAIESLGVREALDAALGAQYILAGDDIGERYRADIIGKYRSAPAFLAKPATTEDVAAVVKIAASHDLSITMVGGQTGTCGGAIARDGGIALSLERMNRIAEIDTISMTLTVEAGCILQIAQEAVEKEGAFLPLDLGSRGSAVIGGCIAANSGGNRVLRWGMMRDMVIGLEVVLADGTVVSSLTKMIKDNAGYHWKELMIGSEGTLGIVTKAVLRLRPNPLTNQTALVALPSFDMVARLLRDLEVSLSGQLSSFELMWGEFFELITTAQLAARPRPMALGHPYYVLVERLGGDSLVDAEQFERVLADQIEAGVIVDAVVAKSENERQALWAVREDLRGGFDPLQPCSVYDVGMALVDMPTFVTEVQHNMEAAYPGAKLVFYGHAGDGNLHLVVSVGKDRAGNEDDIDRVVYETVQTVGGSIAAEHGIGMSRLPFIGLTRSEAELALMARIKQALDPQGMLNPGKVVAL
ncbi:MAG: FAD-binding oxidoreductase [Novosphingobium sp.]|nr:FAD-binding oxidoreductase [Novosphingobium sp.]